MTEPKKQEKTEHLLIWSDVYNKVLKNRHYPQLLFTRRHSMKEAKRASNIILPVTTYLPLEDRVVTRYYCLKEANPKYSTVEVVYHAEALESEERFYTLPTIGLETVMLYFPEFSTKKIRGLEQDVHNHRLPVTMEYASSWNNQPRDVKLPNGRLDETASSLDFYRIISDPPSSRLKKRKVFNAYTVMERNDFFSCPLFFKNRRDGELARRDIFDKGIDNIEYCYKKIKN